MIPKIIVTALTVLILLGGCVDMKNSVPKTDFYTFEYPSPDQSRSLTTPYILKIDAFHVSPIYDDDRLIFRSEAFKRNDFSRHRWRANPGDLVSDYLARDLTQASFFHAVIRSESIPNYTHLLTGTVEEFYQRVENSQWQAVLSISVLLVDDTTTPGNSSILFQHRYSFQEPVFDQTTQGFVSGMSRAMQKLSGTLIEDVFDALTGNTEN
jgi:cholesterol transport system auxiliary component